MRLDVVAYVEAATVLMAMPLDAGRRALVVEQMTRIAAFAARLEALELEDDIEPAGSFTP